MATQDIASTFNIGGLVDGIPDAQYAPDGTYVVEIRKAEAKMSKGGGGKPARPMLVVNCSITSGPYAGMSIYNNFVWVEENATSQRIFKAQMKLMGINFTPATTLGDLANALKGKVLEVEVGHREYNGDVSNQINRWLRLVSTGPSAAPVPGVPAAPAVQAVPTPAAVPAAAVPATPVSTTTVEDAPTPEAPASAPLGAAPPF